MHCPAKMDFFLHFTSLCWVMLLEGAQLGLSRRRRGVFLIFLQSSNCDFHDPLPSNHGLDG